MQYSEEVKSFILEHLTDIDENYWEQLEELSREYFTDKDQIGEYHMILWECGANFLNGVGAMSYIPTYCFYMQPLTEFTIPETVIRIGNRAFLGTKLKKITIPATIRRMGALAFAKCPYLEEVTIETDVLFPVGVFNGCKALKRVKVNCDIEEWKRRLDQGYYDSSLYEQTGVHCTDGIWRLNG